MHDDVLKCGECVECLKPSQCARIKPGGQAAKQSLVCHNHPKCPKAEYG